MTREVVRANQENALGEYGRTLHLTDRWVRHVLTKMECTKPKGITRKPSPPFLVEENSPLKERNLPSY